MLTGPPQLMLGERLRAEYNHCKPLCVLERQSALLGNQSGIVMGGTEPLDRPSRLSHDLLQSLAGFEQARRAEHSLDIIEGKASLDEAQEVQMAQASYFSTGQLEHRRLSCRTRLRIQDRGNQWTDLPMLWVPD